MRKSVWNRSELKIWRGERYEQDETDRLAGYLDAQGQQKGWLVGLCTNEAPPREGGMSVHKGKTVADTVSMAVGGRAVD